MRTIKKFEAFEPRKVKSRENTPQAKKIEQEKKDRYAQYKFKHGRPVLLLELAERLSLDGSAIDHYDEDEWSLDYDKHVQVLFCVKEGEMGFQIADRDGDVFYQGDDVDRAESAITDVLDMVEDDGEEDEELDETFKPKNLDRKDPRDETILKLQKHFQDNPYQTYVVPEDGISGENDTCGFMFLEAGEELKPIVATTTNGFYHVECMLVKSLSKNSKMWYKRPNNCSDTWYILLEDFLTCLPKSNENFISESLEDVENATKMRATVEIRNIEEIANELGLEVEETEIVTATISNSVIDIYFVNSPYYLKAMEKTNFNKTKRWEYGIVEEAYSSFLGKYEEDRTEAIKKIIELIKNPKAYKHIEETFVPRNIEKRFDDSEVGRNMRKEHERMQRNLDSLKPKQQYQVIAKLVGDVERESYRMRFENAEILEVIKVYGMEDYMVYAKNVADPSSRFYFNVDDFIICTVPYTPNER